MQVLKFLVTGYDALHYNRNGNRRLRFKIEMILIQMCIRGWGFDLFITLPFLLGAIHIGGGSAKFLSSL
jgi:hypothetical protein